MDPSLRENPLFRPAAHLGLAGPPQQFDEPAHVEDLTPGKQTAAPDPMATLAWGAPSSDPAVVVAVPHQPVHDPGHQTRTDVATTPALEPPATQQGARSEAAGDVHPDWAVIRELRNQASTRLASVLSLDASIDNAGRRAAALEVIESLLLDHARVQASTGQPLWTRAQEQWATRALMDALFGLGRLQPLVDNPDVENIEITGCDKVRLILRDGRIVIAEPVADTDEELIDFLQFVASRGTASGAERTFSHAYPRMRMSLPGRLRLTASAWLVPRPSVRIRRQTITNTTLAELQQLASFDDRVCAFLTATVRARKNIVVAGEMNAGKTTLVRALAASIPEYESVITLETEWELYLNDLPSRRLRPALTYEARTGTGEFSPNGQRAGAVTLTEIFEGALSENADRVLVGEVRGPEALDMFRAMQAGSGSMSTIHAKNARDTAQRLVTCVSGAGASADYAWGLVATNIDLIVYVRSQIDPETGRRHRWVDEIVEVTSGEDVRGALRPSFSTIFTSPRGARRAEFHTQPTPELLEELVDAGLDASLLRSDWSYR